MGAVKRGTGIVARIVWALVSAGLTFAVVSVVWPGLDLQVLAGITAAAAVLGALLGPLSLELLSAAT
jgi:hypothetical protein